MGVKGGMEEYVQEGWKPLPKAWIDYVKEKKENGQKFQTQEEIKEPGRNDHLMRFGCSLRSTGFTHAEIVETLWQYNLKRCKPSCDRNEVEKIAKSVSRYKRGNGPALQVGGSTKATDKGVHNASRTPENNRKHLETELPQEEALLIGDDTDWVKPLGHRDGDYYYTSSSNPEIVRIPCGSHGQGQLQNLMNYEWWKEKFSSKTGVGWGGAASVLMDTGRKAGLYSEWNHRGRGAWQSGGKTVYHLGRSIYSLQSGHTTELGRFDSGHIFTVSKSLRPPHRQDDSSFKSQKLVELCEALSWEKPESAKLFAGWIAICRMCGCLKWRPHLWITGSKGTGKSTVLDMLLRPLVEEFGLFVEGETTQAGLRQNIKAEAVPIIFDEAETSNKNSDRRIRGIIEFFRQCSFDNDAVTLKGTADGRGHQYKAASMGCLSSIRVNLIEEQDVSRFTVLELKKPQDDQWPVLKKQLENLDHEYGHQLWSYIIRNWGWISEKIVALEDEISALYGDRRLGQQYAPMIAGYLALMGCGELDCFDLGKIIQEVGIGDAKDAEEVDERECLDTICQLEIRVENVTTTIGSALYHTTAEEDRALAVLGIKKTVDAIYIATKNPQLQKKMYDTMWGKLYARALKRLPGAIPTRQRFGSGNARWCIRIPLDLVFPEN